MSINLGGKDYKVDEDKGCNLWPSCNTCPLPVCKDDPGQRALQQRTLIRYLEIASVYRANNTTQRAISRRHRCSIKTVERAISWYRSLQEDN